jgi:hypothetical protein
VIIKSGRGGTARGGRARSSTSYDSPAVATLLARGRATESPYCLWSERSLLSSLCQLACPPENGEHELMVNKLIALAEIYSIPIDQLLRSNDGGYADTLILAQLSSPNKTLLLAEDPQEPETTPFFPPFPVQSPGETTLLATKNGQSRTPYRRAIIGRLDLTLDPMIPAGSIVQIDTRNRAIAPKKDWTHEWARYRCGHSVWRMNSTGR